MSVAVRVLLAAAGVCALAGCPEPLEGPRDIRDIRILPQDCAAYLGPDADTPLASPEVQKQWMGDLRRRFFEPWHLGLEVPPRGEILAPFEQAAKEPGYGENGRRHDAGWARRLWETVEEPNGALYTIGMYRLDRQLAIVLRETDLRRLPTSKPRFDDFYRAGYGYPFDTLQESALWTGTPVRVYYDNNEWAFVVSPLGRGWVRDRDLAMANEKFVADWESQPLCTVVTDDKSALMLPRANRLGTILPLCEFEGSADSNTALVPTSDDPRTADSIGKTGVRLGSDIKPMPIPLTKRRIAAVANNFLGRTYGWGGLYGNRDCSSTMHDLFVPFGIWLPRNSADQAKAGKVIPLKHLPPAERERIILEKGVPFLTLVHPTGHIMLYIGRRDGRAIVLHNFWGLKTVGPGGREGRAIIGRCAITTLQPGVELPDLARPEGDYRNRIEDMVILEPGRAVSNE